MKKKGLTKEKITALFAIITALVLILFIRTPVKTLKVDYDTYEDKTEFKGIYFAQEFVLYTGDVKGIVFKYKDGERIPRGGSISNNISAPESGILIKHLDGYENKYSLDNVSNINENDISKIIEDNSKLQGLKLLNNSEWYIYAFVGQADYFKKGRHFVIEIDGNYYDTEVKQVLKNDNGNYLILKLKDDLNTINLHRGLSGNIIKSIYYGINIPKSALTEYKGSSGVFINFNGYAEFRKIKVLFEGADTVIVVPEKSSRKQLQQYDDVIVKPQGIEEGTRIK